MAQAVEEMGLRLQPADRDEPRMPLTPSTSRCTGEELQAAACARLPRWPAAVPSVRLALEHGQREWVEVEVGSSTIARQTAIYWVTPKVAHTTIARLLQRPPFRVLQTSAGHDGGNPARAFMGHSGESVGQDAVSPRNSSARLQEALARSPLEFTFVRDPLDHLISAAGPQRCERGSLEL